MPSEHRAEGFSSSESSSNQELESHLREQWNESVETWIQKEQAVRTGFLDAWMLRALGDVEGRRVLDIGCGEGRFCRLLAGLGAEVTGIDLTEGLMVRARALSEGVGTYLAGNAHDLAGVEDESFDLAVSYIVMVDLFKYREAIRSAFRVLRPAGRFIVCNIHPMRMAKTNGWIRQGNRKLFYAVDDYTLEGPRVEEVSWTGEGVSRACTGPCPVTSLLSSNPVSSWKGCRSRRPLQPSSPRIPRLTTNTGCRISSCMH